MEADRVDEGVAVAAFVAVLGRESVSVTMKESVSGKDSVTVQLSVSGRGRDPLAVRFSGTFVLLLVRDSTFSSSVVRVAVVDLESEAEKATVGVTLIFLFAEGELKWADKDTVAGRDRDGLLVRDRVIVSLRLVPPVAVCPEVTVRPRLIVRVAVALSVKVRVVVRQRAILQPSVASTGPTRAPVVGAPQVTLGGRVK